MINTIFYFVKTPQEYEQQKNEISARTIVFVEDEKAIYKNGIRYGSVSREDLQELVDSMQVGSTSYVLPVASQSVLGGIKVGKYLTIDNNPDSNDYAKLSVDYNSLLNDSNVKNIIQNIMNNNDIIGDLYYYLSGCKDVKITNPVSGQILVFDGNKWINKDASNIGGGSGSNGQNGQNGQDGYTYDDSRIIELIRIINEDLDSAKANTNAAFDRLNLAIDTLNNTANSEKARLDNVIAGIDTRVQNKVEAITSTAEFLQQFAENIQAAQQEGQVVWQQGWNDKIEEYLQYAGVWARDNDVTKTRWSTFTQGVDQIQTRVAAVEQDLEGRPTSTQWSQITQRVGSIELQVASLTPDDGTGNSATILESVIQQYIEDQIAGLNLESTYARKNAETVVEWMYSALRQQSGADLTFNQIVSAGKNGLTSAISEVRTYVEKLKNDEYVAISDIESAVDNAIVGLKNSASSNNVKSEIFAKLDTNTDNIAGILMAMDPNGSYGNIANKFSNWEAGLVTEAKISGAVANLIAGGATQNTPRAAIIALANDAVSQSQVVATLGDQISALSVTVNGDGSHASLATRIGALESGFVSSVVDDETMAGIISNGSLTKAAILTYIKNNVSGLDLNADDIEISANHKLKLHGSKVDVDADFYTLVGQHITVDASTIDLSSATFTVNAGDLLFSASNKMPLNSDYLDIRPNFLSAIVDGAGLALANDLNTATAEITAIKTNPASKITGWSSLVTSSDLNNYLATANLATAISGLTDQQLTSAGIALKSSLDAATTEISSIKSNPASKITGWSGLATQSYVDSATNGMVTTATLKTALKDSVTSAEKTAAGIALKADLDTATAEISAIKTSPSSKITGWSGLATQSYVNTATSGMITESNLVSKIVANKTTIISQAGLQTSAGMDSAVASLFASNSNSTSKANVEAVVTNKISSVNINANNITIDASHQLDLSAQQITLKARDISLMSAATIDALKSTLSIDTLITNKLEAGTGTFRGTVYASAGEFTGTVNASAGSFTGTVNATQFTAGGSTGPGIVVLGGTWDPSGKDTSKLHIAYDPVQQACNMYIHDGTSWKQLDFSKALMQEDSYYPVTGWYRYKSGQQITTSTSTLSASDFSSEVTLYRSQNNGRYYTSNTGTPSRASGYYYRDKYSSSTISPSDPGAVCPWYQVLGMHDNKYVLAELRGVHIMYGLSSNVVNNPTMSNNTYSGATGMNPGIYMDDGVVTIPTTNTPTRIIYATDAILTWNISQDGTVSGITRGFSFLGGVSTESNATANDIWSVTNINNTQTATSTYISTADSTWPGVAITASSIVSGAYAKVSTAGANGSIPS